MRVCPLRIEPWVVSVDLRDRMMGSKRRPHAIFQRGMMARPLNEDWYERYMKSAITISLVPEARGGPFVLWDDVAQGCREAQQLGFDAIEIFPPSAAVVRERSVAQLLADHNLALAALGTGAGWVKHKLMLTSPDAKIREQAIDFVRSIIDAAGPLNAPAIIGSMQGRWGDGVSRDQAIDWLRTALDTLGQHAAQYHVPLIYEPLNRYETNLCATVAQGVELIGELTTPNVVLLADLFHMNIEEANIADAIRSGSGYIGHVHFVDSNRRPPGLGHLNYEPIITALREIGYNGYLSAEALPWPDSLTAAKQTIKMFDTLLAV